MRSPTPPDSSRPRQTLAWEVVVAAGFCGLLVLAAVFATFRPGRPVGLGVLLAFTAALGWWATVPAGCAGGALAWPFYLGFVVNTGGRLSLPGPADASVLLALITAGAAGVLVRRLGNRNAPTRWTRWAVPPPVPSELTLLILVIAPVPGPFPPAVGAGEPAPPPVGRSR